MSFAYFNCLEVALYCARSVHRMFLIKLKRSANFKHVFSNSDRMYLYFATWHPEIPSLVRDFVCSAISMRDFDYTAGTTIKTRSWFQKIA